MFLDIKLGLAWAFLLAIFFEKIITPEWLIAGVLFALLPDIDFWLEYAKRGTVGGKVIDLHRTLLHSPVTYIPLILFVGSYFGTEWMTLLAFGVFGHFIHDSMGMGYGIRWLWPFSTNWYKLFSNKAGEIYYDFDHFFVLWSDEEMKKLVAERGNDNWVKEEMGYMRHHWFSILWKLLVVLGAILLLIIALPF